MAQAWMPGAERLDGESERTPPGAGAPRAVWTVTGSDPRTRSARQEARRLVSEGRAPHLVWNPLTGEVVQTLAATRRGRLSLGDTHQYELHLDHGHEGRVCLVIAVVSPRETPFTEGPMRALAQILGWLDSWGVERVWRAGSPGAQAAGEVARVWARGGHFGHDQVPGSTVEGPGALDTARLLARAPSGAPEGTHLLPEPRPSAMT